MKRGIFNRGQITIFVIIALIIVAVVVLFLFLRGGTTTKIGGGITEADSESFMKTCLEDKVRGGIGIISNQGGYIEPVLYKGIWFDEEGPIDVSYLCYTKEDYVPCINQEPLLIKHIQDEIKDYIQEDVEECFKNLKKSLEKGGYTTEGELDNFDIKIKPQGVIIEINSELVLTKSGETSRKDGFEITFKSGFYNIIEFVKEIIKLEQSMSNFDYATHMAISPNFDIKRITTSDLSKVYTIKSQKTQKVFRFAVRGRVIPPGWGITLEEEE